MTSRDFAYWLQGFFEIQNPTTLNQEQLTMIQAQLNLVFKHEIDPSMGDIKHQAELNKIHNTYPTTEEEAIAKWGKSPGPAYDLSWFHGWYKADEGVPRC
jgi:hypothetical protein